MTTKAVRYTQPLLGALNPAGYLGAVPGAAVLIRQNGVACAVFADNNRTAMTNPIPTGVPQGTAGLDVEGTLLVYLDPGRGYDGVATVGNVSTTFALPDISPDVSDVALPTNVLSPANNLSELASAAAARTNLGLGSAATQPTSAFSPPIPSGTYVDTTTAQTIGGAKDFTIAPTVNGSAIGGTTADATTTTKGKLQLAGDLGGTAAAPTVPGKQRLHAFDPRDYGAKCDGRRVFDGAMSSTVNPTILACPTSLPFATDSVGKQVSVQGAGAAGANLVTTIAGFTDTGHVTLSTPALTTVASNAVVTFGTDDTTAVLATLTACQAAGGGEVTFYGWSICVGQLPIPHNATPTIWEQKPMIWRGSGASFIPQLSAYELPMGGSVLDLWYQGSVAKVDTRARGTLEIVGMTIVDSGWGSTPFIQTTNTTLLIHHNAFYGNPGKSGAAGNCDQDVILLGGNDPAQLNTGNLSNSPFQGYGTEISHNQFNRIQRGVWARAYANDVKVERNTFGYSCGVTQASGAAFIDFNSASSAINNSGGHISGNLMEVTFAYYAIQCINSAGNEISWNGFWDPDRSAGDASITNAYVHFGSGGTNNVVYMLAKYAVQDGQQQVKDESTGTTNSLLNFGSPPGDGSVPSYFAPPVDFWGGLAVMGAASTMGPGGVQFTRSKVSPIALTDGVLYSTTTVTSVTKPFRPEHVGSVLTDSASGIPANATITAITTPATASAWAATTAYAAGAIVVPAVANGHLYVCTTAGTSGGAQPTFPINGTTVADGSVVWTDSGRSYAATLSTAATVTGSGRSLTIAPYVSSISITGFTDLTTPNNWVALGQTSKFGPAANFVSIGSLGTTEAWVDAAQGSGTNIALELRAKGTKPINALSHIEISTTAPTAAAVSTNATSVGVGISTDNAGDVTFTTAAGLAADTSVVTVTFNKAFGGLSGAAPRGLVVGPVGAAAAAAQPYLVSKSTTTMVIGLHNPPAGAVAMTVSWVAF